MHLALSLYAMWLNIAGYADVLFYLVHTLAEPLCTDRRSCHKVVLVCANWPPLKKKKKRGGGGRKKRICGLWITSWDFTHLHNEWNTEMTQTTAHHNAESSWRWQCSLRCPVFLFPNTTTIDETLKRLRLATAHHKAKSLWRWQRIFRYSFAVFQPPGISVAASTPPETIQPVPLRRWLRVTCQ